MNRVITKSENISLPQELTLSVTLDQLINAIGFEVSQHAGLQHVTGVLPCIVSMRIQCQSACMSHVYRLPIGGQYSTNSKMPLDYRLLHLLAEPHEATCIHHVTSINTCCY